MRQDFRSKDGDVVSCVGFSRNVEVLLGILGELLEEESKECVDVLSSGNSVAHGAPAVGVAHVDRLVKEDDGRIRVPRVWVVHELELVVNRGRAELEEEARERRAARATIQPQHNRVVLRVIARLEEPCSSQHRHR